MNTIQVGPVFGANLRTLRLLENGQITRQLPQETLPRLCNILNCTPEALTEE